MKEYVNFVVKTSVNLGQGPPTKWFFLRSLGLPWFFCALLPSFWYPYQCTPSYPGGQWCWEAVRWPVAQPKAWHTQMPTVVFLPPLTDRSSIRVVSSVRDDRSWVGKIFSQSKKMWKSYGRGQPSSNSEWILWKEGPRRREDSEPASSFGLENCSPSFIKSTQSVCQ